MKKRMRKAVAIAATAAMVGSLPAGAARIRKICKMLRNCWWEVH